jgi:hypothetical protein
MKKKKDFAEKNMGMIAMGAQVKKNDYPNHPPGWTVWQDLPWR